MNLLLLEPSEIDALGQARLRGRRAEHARQVLKIAALDELRVGVRGGLVGKGTVVASDPAELVLTVTLDSPPPARPGIDVVLAMPRPKALNRVIPALASFGVDRIVLLNAARVEKSYFDSTILAHESLRELCDLGLEQSKDTVAPSITIKPRFKPFVEDELDTFAAGTERFLLHPTGATPAKARPVGERLCLAIGPDGGWVPFELDLLGKAGFESLTLGARTLRVEVAVPVILGALRPFF